MRYSLFKHYKQLWHYNFHRYEKNNYQEMREYFAELLIYDLEPFMSLHKKHILDVGGANGEFCKVLNQNRGCYAINLDPNPKKPVWPNTLIGRANHIPCPDGQFDLILCRGVLEHIPPEELPGSLSEMYRVTKKGGIAYINIPPWYNPHAGHGLKPFHMFGFSIAKFLTELFYRKKIIAKSFEDMHLYKITYEKMLKLLEQTSYKIIATQDNHFRLHLATKIPLIREVLIPAISFILTK